MTLSPRLSEAHSRTLTAYYRTSTPELLFLPDSGLCRQRCGPADYARAFILFSHCHIASFIVVSLSGDIDINTASGVVCVRRRNIGHVVSRPGLTRYGLLMTSQCTRSHGRHTHTHTPHTYCEHRTQQSAAFQPPTLREDLGDVIHYGTAVSRHLYDVPSVITPECFEMRLFAPLKDGTSRLAVYISDRHLSGFPLPRDLRTTGV